LKAGSWNIYTPTCTATLFTLGRGRKQSKCPLTEAWMSKMWYIHTMQHCGLRKEILSHTTAWMESWRDYAKRSKSVTKHKYCTISLRWGSIARVVKLTETESRMVATRGWRPLKGYIIPVLQNEKVLKMCCTARRIHYWTVSLKNGEDYTFFTIKRSFQVLMAPICNPSYLGGWNQESHSSRPVRKNSSWDPISKIARAKWTESKALRIEHLLCKNKAQSSNLSPTKKKKVFKMSERRNLIYPDNLFFFGGGPYFFF
jgi:hypothetical protein